MNQQKEVKGMSEEQLRTHENKFYVRVTNIKEFQALLQDSSRKAEELELTLRKLRNFEIEFQLLINGQ